MSHPTPHHPLTADAAPCAPARPTARGATGSPPVRWELVARVRAELARGTYPLEAAWARTLERLELLGDGK